MMDQYKEQYKKETEQIHAPMDLIVRTKAAVREEEARVQRERAVQQTGRQADFTMEQTATAQKKRSYGAAARRWAYPLSAVAAVIVLVSISLTMRGLGKSASESLVDTAATEAESGGELAAEGAAGAVFDEKAQAETLMAATAAYDEESAEAEADYEEGFSSEAATAEAEGFAPEAAYDGASVQEEADEASVPQVDDFDEANASQADTGGAVSAAELTDMTEKKESEMRSAGAAEVTVKKVSKKPAFVNRADAESRTYEELVFRVIEEKDGWAAYVEYGSGDGYVIRGKAETVEAFLEAGYKRLEEIIQ